MLPPAYCYGSFDEFAAFTGKCGLRLLSKVIWNLLLSVWLLDVARERSPACVVLQ